MQAKLSTIFVVGILVVACATLLVLPAGCQSESQLGAVGLAGVGPVRGPADPGCRQVSTLDADTALAVERAYGYEPSFTVTICEEPAAEGQD